MVKNAADNPDQQQKSERHCPDSLVLWDAQECRNRGDIGEDQGERNEGGEATKGGSCGPDDGRRPEKDDSQDQKDGDCQHGSLGVIRLRYKKVKVPRVHPQDVAGCQTGKTG
jgi:hypothetical protein